MPYGCVQAALKAFLAAVDHWSCCLLREERRMVGGGGSMASSRSLEQTPTWAVAAICVLLVAVSVILEHLISSLGNWLRNRRKKLLSEALEKLKSELMLLGFLSLLLTVAQRPLSSICVPAGVANKMLPCKKTHTMGKLPVNAHYRNSLLKNNHSSYGDDIRELNYASYEQKFVNSMQPSDRCKKGLVTLISQGAIYQLHIHSSSNACNLHHSNNGPWQSKGMTVAAP